MSLLVNSHFYFGAFYFSLSARNASPLRSRYLPASLFAAVNGSFFCCFRAKNGIYFFCYGIIYRRADRAKKRR